MNTNKWRAQMMIDGTVRNLGSFSDEDEAGSAYAKAAYKYKPSAPKTGFYGGLDLRNVPNQPLILRANKASYKGVKANKQRWQARIKTIHLGTFDTKEEAAQVYANAAFHLENESTK
jgi:AP2 domain